jgi:uncharacterized protein involved in response to NO
VPSIVKKICDAPVLSGGFRPFFLGAAIFVAVAIALWLPAYFGEIVIPTAFAPRDWHVHEMLFGFAPAVIAGFLLTAVPNWTGRLPLKGAPLLVLVSAWLAGRIAVFFSALIPWWAALLLDNLFVALLLGVILREIVAGENWRNLRVASLVALLLTGNVAFHVEAHVVGSASYGQRAGISAIIMLITLIGGRIIPSFTRNWLARMKGGRLPAIFGKLDAAAVAATAIGLASWTIFPDAEPTGAALAIAGVLQATRLARWAGERTLDDRLVFVLHAAYAFIPVGLLLLAVAALAIVPQSAGVHALAAGGIGLMTLAVMSRVNLGHSGHKLVASRAVQIAYAAIALAALFRIAAALAPSATYALLHLAALCWIAGFVTFACSSWTMLVSPRRR